jgi:hypothetical protein
MDVLGELRERGACEIGTHPHPWNTPPIQEERNPFNSFICNLPSALQFEKIRTLTETIATNFRVRPTAYRCGRWGFDAGIARHLLRLGYRVDTSIFPGWDWAADGGRDFSHCSHEPYIYAQADRTLLEIPATNGFLQSPRVLASRAFRYVKRVPLGNRVLAVLRRTGVLNYVCLSPEMSNARDMIRLVRKLADQGTNLVNVYFHSPTLLEGCSPFTRTQVELAEFLRRIEDFLEFAESAGLRSVGISELHASEVGATEVKELHDLDTAAA